MKDTMNENRSLLILLGILVFVILGALYYYLVLPKSEAKESMTQSISALTNDTHQLQKEIDKLSVIEEEPNNEMELRTKLPKKRALNTLLLSLQEAELVSEAKIISVSFNDYDGLVSESDVATRTEEEESTKTEAEESENDEVADESDEEIDEEKPHTQIDIGSLPDALKLLSLDMEVSVQDYEHLLTLLKEIESIERVMRIDNIDFKQIGEEGFAMKDVDDQTLIQIQLTTFYSEEEED